MPAVRILFLIDNLRPGGAQKALLALLKALRATKTMCTVWRLGGTSSIESEFTALGVRVIGRDGGFWDTAGAPWALVRYLRRERVNLVQTLLFHSDVLGRVAARLARKGGRTPIVVSSIRATNRRNRLWQFMLQRSTAPLAHAFTAVSQRTLEYAVAHEGVRMDRAWVIPNGIDLAEWASLPSREAARQELDLPVEGLIIGTVGRLHEQKGHRFLLEAAQRVVKEHPNATFVIAGYGPLENALKDQARALGLGEHVRFPGYRTDVPRLLAAFDIFTLPSLWEGMSNALLEAMAAGLPVAATAVDGALDQVEPGVTGLLVPPADSAALAEALLLLCRSPERRHEMGGAGRERVAREFPVQRMTDATLDLYAQMLNRYAGIAPEQWRS